MFKLQKVYASGKYNIRGWRQYSTRPHPSTFPKQSWPSLPLTLGGALELGKINRMDSARSNCFCQICQIFFQIWIFQSENFKLLGKYHLHTLTRRGSPVNSRPSNDEAPPIGKIHPFRKMTVAFEPLMPFFDLHDLERFWSLWHSLFYNWKSNL